MSSSHWTSEEEEVSPASPMVPDGVVPDDGPLEESDLSSTDYEMEAYGANYLLPLTEWVAPGRSGLPPSPGLPTLAVYFLCMARAGDSYSGAHQRCNTAIATSAWRRMHGEYQINGISRCPICHARYWHGTGALLEFADVHDGYLRYQYGRAGAVPQRIRELLYQPDRQDRVGIG